MLRNGIGIRRPEPETQSAFHNVLTTVANPDVSIRMVMSFKDSDSGSGTPTNAAHGGDIGRERQKRHDYASFRESAVAADQRS